MINNVCIVRYTWLFFSLYIHINIPNTRTSTIIKPTTIPMIAPVFHFYLIPSLSYPTSHMLFSWTLWWIITYMNTLTSLTDIIVGARGVRCAFNIGITTVLNAYRHTHWWPIQVDLWWAYYVVLLTSWSLVPIYICCLFVQLWRWRTGNMVSSLSAC